VHAGEGKEEVEINLMHHSKPTAFECTLLSAAWTDGAAGRGGMLLPYKNRWLKGDVIHLCLC